MSRIVNGRWFREAILYRPFRIAAAARASLSDVQVPAVARAFDQERRCFSFELVVPEVASLEQLKLSKPGLGARDSLVLSELGNHPIPVAIVMADGYAPNVEDIVDIHLETIRTAAEYE